MLTNILLSLISNNGGRITLRPSPVRKDRKSKRVTDKTSSIGASHAVQGSSAPQADTTPPPPVHSPSQSPVDPPLLDLDGSTSPPTLFSGGFGEGEDERKKLHYKVKRQLWHLRWKYANFHQGKRAPRIRPCPYEPRSFKSTWIIGKPSLTRVVEWINSRLASLNVEVLSFNTKLFIWKVRVWGEKHMTSYTTSLNLYEDKKLSSNGMLHYLVQFVHEVSELGSYQAVKSQFTDTFRKRVTYGFRNVPADKLVCLRARGFLEDTSSVEDVEYTSSSEDDMYPQPLLVRADSVINHQIVGNPIRYFRDRAACPDTSPYYSTLIDALDKIFDAPNVNVNDATEAIMMIFQEAYDLTKYNACERCVDLKQILQDEGLVPDRRLLDKLLEMSKEHHTPDKLKELVNTAYTELICIVPTLVKSSSQDSQGGGGGGGGVSC